MLRLNEKAFLETFDLGMSYPQCREAFQKAGYGNVPIGEYLLMIGVATAAVRTGVAKEVLIENLYIYDMPFAGLGDTIAKITHATGLDKLSNLYTQITGKPCGCAGRQEALNKLIPYGIKEES
jgi:hypothetical protein